MSRSRYHLTSVLLAAGTLTLAACADGPAPVAPDHDEAAMDRAGAAASRGNKPPIVDAGGPYQTVGAAVIQFNAAASDPDGPQRMLRYAWSFGDGATGTGASTGHAYAAPGAYTVVLTVTDLRGGVSADTTTATVFAPGTLVHDDFARLTTGSWGSADVGGLWRIDEWLLDAFRVDGSRGLIVASTSAPRNVVATDGYGLNVRGLVSFSIDRMPDNPGRFYTVQVYARRDDRFGDGDDYYRYRVRAFGTGQMDLRVEKAVRTVPTWLTDIQPISTVWTPGQRYWIRWEAVGVSPSTTLRMRVWADGTAEPTTWQTSTVVDEPALDVAGTTGVRVAGPSADQVNFPVTFAFDDLRYVSVD